MILVYELFNMQFSADVKANGHDTGLVTVEAEIAVANVTTAANCRFPFSILSVIWTH